jgi:hypothetical protein
MCSSLGRGGCTEAKTFSQSTIVSTVENGKLHPRKLLKKNPHLRVLRLAAYNLQTTKSASQKL